MKAVRPISGRWMCPGRFPVGPGVLALLLSIACVAAPAAAGATAQAGRVRELPSLGTALDASLAQGQSDDWQVELAASEFLDITVELVTPGESDEWPAVAVTAPGGATLSDSTEPNIVSGIDSWPRMVVSFTTDRAGLYRLRVAARASLVRYRLRVDERRLAVEADRQRLAAHRLWREGMRSYLVGSPEALRAAVAKFEEALTVVGGIEDREAEAATLSTIAALWYQLSDGPRGTLAARRALEIWKQLGRDREVGTALSDLGLLAYLAYDHTAARGYYDQALAKHRATADVEGEGRTLTRLGWVQYAAAELQQVVETNQQALAIYKAIGDPSGESIAYNDLGRAYLDLGEISPALDALQHALVLRPTDRYPRGAANVLIRIGLVYLAVAEWQRALDALQQARTLAQRVHDTRSEITTLVNLGSAYVTFGDTTEGFRYLEPALERAKSIDFRGAQAYALLWLGVGASVNGEPARSRDYLQQAIAIQTGIKDVRGQATTMRQLAAVQLDLNSPHDALASITKSIEISPKASGLIYTGALTLANVYAALGDASTAQAQYEEALARFRDVRARNAEALALTRYGRFQAGQGRYAEARDLLDQALKIHESLRGLIVDPDLRMSYGSTSLGPYQLFVDVLMELDRRSPGAGFAAEAFHANERARARGLLDMLATSGIDIREGVDKTLVERERSLRWNLNRKAAIQTTVLAGKRDERRLATLEKEIADLSRSWRETTTLIRQQSPAYASLTEPEPLTAADVGKLLDANTVLLAFAPGETNSWLFAVTRDGLESFALAPRQAVEDAARDVHRLLTARQPIAGESAADRQARVARADAELARRSRELSDLVLGPIAARLATAWRGRRLAVVASGALEYVPFAALPLPQSAGNARASLITAHEVVTLPSASSLALLRRDTARPAAQKMIAVLADPVFAADDPRVGKPRVDNAGGGVPTDATRGAADDEATTRALAPFVEDSTRASLARLPFSRAEALAVASQVPPASLLQATDFDATLSLATSGRLNDYRIVHFATHGLINTKRPELSGLALSLVDRDGRSRDGFLRLNTIYNLRLSADLVVLSACQTALGKEIAGEGLVGLTRGFMYAGARRVVASLWQVSDAATAELMKRFYAGMLQQHLAPAAALRSAQREMAKDARWSSPYYWAGFVLQGDWQQ
jgi:CHAT domain-containing protein/tetratricopeptide (TPR) repeat protein